MSAVGPSRTPGYDSNSVDGVDGGAADLWFHWLLQARHGSDRAYAAALAPMLDEIRDRLLDNADLGVDKALADIGSGDGLVAFGALERQPSLHATLVDISPALIAYTRERAKHSGLSNRCRFIVASAESLDVLGDASFDVVTVRAVVAYLDDKEEAIRECYRILRPGGRISLVDPIFQDRAFELAGFAAQQNSGDNSAGLTILDYLHRCGAAHLPDTIEGIRSNPLTNYNERNLLRWFADAGFVNIHLRLHVDIISALPIPWEVYLATSPRAGAPTIERILATRFSAAERSTFEQVFRPGVEAGTTVERNTNAYIFADKPHVI